MRPGPRCETADALIEVALSQGILGALDTKEGDGLAMTDLDKATKLWESGMIGSAALKEVKETIDGCSNCIAGVLKKGKTQDICPNKNLV